MTTNHSPMTINSATLVLAYTQHYNCKFVPGRCLTDSHLRRLAIWVGHPDHELRSVRNHPALAVHLALLKAANLLMYNQMLWYLPPKAYQWLHQPSVDRISALLLPFETCQFEAATTDLGFSHLLTLDTKAYLQQQLSAEIHAHAQQKTVLAKWLTIQPECWQLSIPQKRSDSILFHLLQLGDWMPQQPLTITPDSIAQAIQQGYSLTHIQFLLGKATGTLLTNQQSGQLIDWFKRVKSIQLHPVYLLSVKKSEQLTHIIGNRRLYQLVQEQISPRHAIVSPAIQTPLQKWAVRHNYFLDHFPETAATQDVDPTGYQWLGLKLLVSLGQIIPLPYPAPHAELAALSQQFAPEMLVQLSTLADQLLETMQSAISGRDAFFPADHSPTPHLLQQIKAAMQQPSLLDIFYRTLNAPEPKWHTIEPLRLEKIETMRVVSQSKMGTRKTRKNAEEANWMKPSTRLII